MVATLKPAFDQLQINDYLLKKGLADLSHEHEIRRPLDRGNSINWIMGHITRSRFGLAARFGIEDQFPFGEAFQRGQLVTDDDDLPLMKEVMQAWEEITPKLTARMESITEDELSKTLDFDFPGNDNSLVGFATFIAYHESYHVGQISFIKKLFGLDGLVD